MSDQSYSPQVPEGHKLENGLIVPGSALPQGSPPCEIAPFGWRCTRVSGHSGPCAAVETDEAERYKVLAQLMSRTGRFDNYEPSPADVREWEALKRRRASVPQGSDPPEPTAEVVERLVAGVEAAWQGYIKTQRPLETEFKYSIAGEMRSALRELALRAGPPGGSPSEGARMYQAAMRYGAAMHTLGQEAVRRSEYHPRAIELADKALAELRAGLPVDESGGAATP